MNGMGNHGCDKNSSPGVHSNASRCDESVERRTVFQRAGATPGEVGYDAGTGDFADGSVSTVSDEQISVPVLGHRRRAGEARDAAGSVSVSISVSHAREGADNASRGDSANLVGPAVGHIENAVAVNREATRIPEASCRPGSIRGALDAGTSG